LDLYKGDVMIVNERISCSVLAFSKLNPAQRAGVNLSWIAQLLEWNALRDRDLSRRMLEPLDQGTNAANEGVNVALVEANVDRLTALSFVEKVAKWALSFFESFLRGFFWKFNTHYRLVSEAETARTHHHLASEEERIQVEAERTQVEIERAFAQLSNSHLNEEEAILATSLSEMRNHGTVSDEIAKKIDEVENENKRIMKDCFFAFLRPKINEVKEKLRQNEQTIQDAGGENLWKKWCDIVATFEGEDRLFFPSSLQKLEQFLGFGNYALENARDLTCLFLGEEAEYELRDLFERADALYLNLSQKELAESAYQHLYNGRNDIIGNRIGDFRVFFEEVLARKEARLQRFNQLQLPEPEIDIVRALLQTLLQDSVDSNQFDRTIALLQGEFTEESVNTITHEEIRDLLHYYLAFLQEKSVERNTAISSLEGLVNTFAEGEGKKNGWSKCVQEWRKLVGLFREHPTIPIEEIKKDIEILERNVHDQIVRHAKGRIDYLQRNYTTQCVT
jgi:hypothetical protein